MNNTEEASSDLRELQKGSSYQEGHLKGGTKSFYDTKSKVESAELLEGKNLEKTCHRAGGEIPKRRSRD